VTALVGSGYEVVGLARTPEKARLLRALGAEAFAASVFDHDRLVDLLAGADAVCSFSSHVPIGIPALRPHAWRLHDRMRSEGVHRVVAAAHEARVRRLVHESVSYVYADQGDAWIDEDSPVEITCATEPVSVGESHVRDFAEGGAAVGRVGVILRFGGIVGDDAPTRATLRSVRHGQAVGLGSPDGWAHVVHTDDLGAAVVAALGVPSGVYNVGAEPVRRAELVAGYAAAAGRDDGAFIGSLTRRVGGARLEPLSRSLRVSGARFTAASGWSPSRPRFSRSWLTSSAPADGVLR
jgi:nucleoside-diphosphate-sugar epimerase